VVGINTTEFYALVLLDAARTKYTIIGEIALDGVIVLGGKQLEVVFGCDGFFTSSRDVWSEMEKPASMVHKKGACMVAFCSRCATVGRNESWCRALYLIARNAVTWCEVKSI
jgi:hypothetical protein